MEKSWQATIPYLLIFELSDLILTVHMFIAFNCIKPKRKEESQRVKKHDFNWYLRIYKQMNHKMKLWTSQNKQTADMNAPCESWIRFNLYKK